MANTVVHGATAVHVEHGMDQYRGIGIEDRKPFIAKVFSIIGAMLLVTFGWIFLALNVEKIRLFIFATPILMWISMIVFICMAFSMICFYEQFRKAPNSYIFLTLFTIMSSYMLGGITISYDSESIYIATIITACVVFGLSLLAVFSPIDFTGMGGYLSAALLALIVSSIVGGIVCWASGNECRTMNIIFAGIGALIFSLYLVYDIQMIVGGSHRRFQYDKEDYLIASVSVYLDIVNLFLDILQLVSHTRD